MFSKATQKIALIKLAGIGDVALACHALNDFFDDHGASLELHWIIDESLIPLAKSLLKTRADVKATWHPIHSAELFRGGLRSKINITLKIFRIIAALQPSQVLLLHRDWRYKAALRPAFFGRIISVTRQPVHELRAYQLVLGKLGLPKSRSKSTTKPVQHAHSNQIGVLVGGASNAKGIFAEKRWPYLEKFIDLVLKNTSKTVLLFGGPEDVLAANEIIKNTVSAGRIVNLVGKFKLDELAPALSKLDSFVSIDSGLAHIASAVMTAPHQKIISLFGPTDPAIWQPMPKARAQVTVLYKPPQCSPCYKNDGHFKPCIYTGDMFQHCMKSISPEEVLAAVSSDAANVS